MRKLVLVILSVLLLCGCSSKKQEPLNSIEDFSGKKLGMCVGTFHDKFIDDNYGVDAIYTYLATYSDLLVALRSNKIDGFTVDTPFASLLKTENNDVASFELPNSDIDCGLLFSKDSLDILADFNAFLAESKENGFLDSMMEKWVDNPSSENTATRYDYVPTKKTIRVITAYDNPPYCFEANGQPDGYLFEVFFKFAYEYGYDFEITGSSFDGILLGISSNKYDIGINEITMTPERMASMQFSDPVNSCSISIMTLRNTDEEVYTSVSQLEGKNMGCMSGSIFDSTISQEIDGASITYFNSRSELILGLQENKIEGYLADRPVAMVVCNENESIKYIDEPISTAEYGFCFSDDASNIRQEFNTFLNKIKLDGTLDSLKEKWINSDAINKTVDEVNLTGTNGTIKACTTPDAAPFSFYKNGKYEGFEVELLNMFALEYDYDVLIDSVSFDAIISAVSSNKYDIAFNGLYITEERKKSVDFSDPIHSDAVVAVVRSGVSQKMSFIDSIKDKYHKTFIEEDRYKIILHGIGTTLLISAASLVLGTVIGFIIFLLTRKLGPWFKKLNDGIAYIISGLPVVVLLMVLFYIVFAKSKMSGVIISIVGFSIIICFSVYGMFKTGVGNIDNGQFEGALALGYTDNQTLFKFVLPQALRIIMPSYRAEIVSLIKSTSVVGYVTVEDLTRASDLIRSRTYDAFFPLIVTAVIYFLLAWMITKIVDKLQIKFLPNEKSKEEILKSIGRK